MSISTKIAGIAIALAATFAVTGAMAAQATASVNVRSGPGVGYAAIDTLYPGEQVNVRTCQGGWCFIDQDGPSGWVSGSYIVDSPIVVQPPVVVRPPVVVAPQQPSVSFNFGVPGFSFQLNNRNYVPYNYYRDSDCVRRDGRIFCPVN